MQTFYLENSFCTCRTQCLGLPVVYKPISVGSWWFEGSMAGVWLIILLTPIHWLDQLLLPACPFLPQISVFSHGWFWHWLRAPLRPLQGLFIIFTWTSCKLSFLWSFQKKPGKTQVLQYQDLHWILPCDSLGLPCLYTSFISPLIWDFTEIRSIYWFCCCMALATMGPSPMSETPTHFVNASVDERPTSRVWEQAFKDFVKLPTLPPGKPGTPFSPFSPTPPKPWGKMPTLNLWSLWNWIVQS